MLCCLLIYSIKIGDPVIALHPHYEFSYAPGQIIQIPGGQSKLMVRFYDYTEDLVHREEVFKLHILKFQHDVDYINNCESKWIGLNVLARNNDANTYTSGNDNYTSVKSDCEIE